MSTVEAKCIECGHPFLVNFPPSLDVRQLAIAIRLVEVGRANMEGVEFTGPDPRWYDGYAVDIAEQYALLVKA